MTTATKPQQTFFPWGDTAVPKDAVDAVTVGVPEHAETVTPERAAQIMKCSARTVRNRIEEGVLLVRYVGASPDSERRHARIVVRLDRPFDPNRKSLMTLEEATIIFSNIGG